MTSDASVPAKRFRFPAPATWVPVAAFALLSLFFFYWLCIPVRSGRGLTFNWRPRYWFAPPQHGSLVAVSMPGHAGLVLLRVVAAGGDTVAFRQGQLELNGRLRAEPYARGPCRWNLEPVRVAPGDLFVALDDRTGPLDDRTAGRVPRNAVVGGPLW